MEIVELESVQYYRKFLDKIDDLTAEIHKEYPDDINCKQKCTDCCKNILNISVIEAFYLQQGFDKLETEVKEIVLNNIDNAEKKLTNSAEKITETTCPLLIDELCILYDYRPVICRTFGYPIHTEQTGEIATCPLNFLDKRDNEHTIKAISSNLLSTNCVLLSQYLLKEFGENIDDKYIPPLFSLLEVLKVSNLLDKQFQNRS